MAYSQAEGGRETGKSTTREACSREREEIVAKPEAEKLSGATRKKRRSTSLEWSTAIGARCWWKAAGGHLDGPNAKG
jgi:hypothetical protein